MRVVADTRQPARYPSPMLVLRVPSALLCIALSPFSLASLIAQETTAVPVTLVVTNGSGAPLPDAKLTLLPPPDTSPATQNTPANGTLSLRLEPGSYHVEITKVGFNTLAKDIEVTPAGDHSFRFPLVPLGEECAEGCPKAPAAAPKPDHPAAPAFPATIPPAVPSHPIPAALQPYSTCQFQDDLQVATLDQLAAGTTSRDVETSDGHRKIDIETALTVGFQYPRAGPYSTAKVEKLPSDSYPQLKQWLIDNFRFLYNNSANTVVNRKDLGPINGYEVRGFDHVKLDDDVLGVYIMFDDPNHIVTTFNLLNQDNQDRRFSTVKQYQQLRDQFLTAYTFCVRANQPQQ